MAIGIRISNDHIPPAIAIGYIVQSTLAVPILAEA
jgi:hypothetical protein